MNRPPPLDYYSPYPLQPCNTYTAPVAPSYQPTYMRQPFSPLDNNANALHHEHSSIPPLKSTPAFSAATTPLPPLATRPLPSYMLQMVSNFHGMRERCEQGSSYATPSTPQFEPCAPPIPPSFYASQRPSASTPPNPNYYYNRYVNYNSFDAPSGPSYILPPPSAPSSSSPIPSYKRARTDDVPEPPYKRYCSGPESLYCPVDYNPLESGNVKPLPAPLPHSTQANVPASNRRAVQTEVLDLTNDLTDDEADEDKDEEDEEPPKRCERCDEASGWDEDVVACALCHYQACYGCRHLSRPAQCLCKGSNFGEKVKSSYWKNYDYDRDSCGIGGGASSEPEESEEEEEVGVECDLCGAPEEDHPFEACPDCEYKACWDCRHDGFDPADCNCVGTNFGETYEDNRRERGCYYDRDSDDDEEW